MERERKGRPPRRTPLLIGLSLSALLASCVDLDASLSIAQDAKVRLKAVYSVSSLVLPLFTEGQGTFPVQPPLSRAELDGYVAAVQGSRLVSYAESATSISRSFDITVDFPNPAAFCSFLSLAAGGASFQSDAGRKILSIILPCPAPRADQDLVSSLDVLFGAYRLRLKADLPSVPLSAPAARIEGKTVSFESSLVDLVRSGKNAEWNLSW